MYSGEGEEVKLVIPVQPSGNVEDWLRDVEKSMKASLRENINLSLQAYPQVWLAKKNENKKTNKYTHVQYIQYIFWLLEHENA